MKAYYEGTIQGATPVTSPYRIVTVSNDGTVLAATAGAGNGIIEDPGGATAGDACSVVRAGPTKVYCEAAVTIDDHVTGGTSGGEAAVATSGDVKVAAVLSAAGADEFADVYVTATLGQHSAAP